MLDSAKIARAVADSILEAAVHVRSDYLDALRLAAERERSPRGREVISQLLENASIADAEGVPACQDTGTVWVLLELGEDECVCGDLATAVDAAVAETYRLAGLRMSVVRDALVDRTNTGDNTPAFLDIKFRSGRGARVHVMLKGGGSDNASRVVMLAPGEGLDAVERVVVDAVEAKAAAACPPLVIGVGVGATFDKVGGLSKYALLRAVGGRSPDARVAALESRVLSAVNATGIGPGGLGGDTTALAVHIETAPCHIAAMPVAVNLGCCAMRSVTKELA
jgi:fumarate hydratase subunit alpha